MSELLFSLAKLRHTKLYLQKKISGADKYFSNKGLLAALKEAEEDIAAGRVREVKDPSQLWEGIQ